MKLTEPYCVFTLWTPWGLLIFKCWISCTNLLPIYNYLSKRMTIHEFWITQRYIKWLYFFHYVDCISFHYVGNSWILDMFQCWTLNDCISFHYGHVLGKCWMCKNGYFWKDVIFQQILITLSWNWQSHIVFSHYGPHEVFWYLNVGLAAPTYFLSTITSPRGWQFMNFGSLNVTSNDCISFHYVGNSWILDHSMLP